MLCCKDEEGRTSRLGIFPYGEDIRPNSKGLVREGFLGSEQRILIG